MGSNPRILEDLAVFTNGSIRIVSKSYARLNILFQRRHIIEHKEGIVDQQYVDRSGDHTYNHGERIVVSKADIDDSANLVELLATELRK